ncbi:hypothetical protein GTQ99_04765 [Kineococcus sp. T13]|uniref:hypothetical protein n=1 Tax=Kineococcus vitellinus TaxID=2696565 RepID=UPI001412150C|nr:hypothetical protein [Kineococcus vitellinus]NAZ74736.1 hypothetical protein [Kineococcus vitellinus]
MRGTPRSLSCLLAGAAFGALDSVVNHVSSITDPAALTTGQQVARFLSYLLNAGWAWAALAVLAGWWVRTWLLGAAAGWVSVSGAVLAYYVTDARVRGESFSSYGGEVLLWLAACVLLCAPLGLAGACTRRRDVWGLVAGLVVPVGAGVIVYPEAVWARWTVWVVAAVGAVLSVRRWWDRRSRSASADVGAPS